MIRLFDSDFYKEMKPPERTQQAASLLPKEVPSEQRSQSLREAIIWCGMQTVTDVGNETADTRRRRALFDESSKLFFEAHQSGEKYPTGRTFQRAEVLLADANPDSLILLREQLRSTSLLPRRMYNDTRISNISELFDEATTKRSKELKQFSAETTSQFDSNRGRILNYWPYENLACGAAEYSSNGFFDVNNVPPWDTWFSYDGKVLQSWVPEILIPLVIAGIDVNPEGCISWAD